MNDDDMKPVEKWLAEQKPSTRDAYKRRFQDFLDWAKTTDEEIFSEWKESKDRDEFIKKWSGATLRYYQYWLEKSGKVNTARSMVNAVRSFFNSQCSRLKLKKGAIAKPKAAKGEHVFSQRDLMKMFQYGDVKEKAMLSTAVSLGWSAGDFRILKREFLEKQIRRARDEKLSFISFDWEREKTGETMVGILTPEALDSLEEWFKKIPSSEWAFPSNGNGDQPISDDLLNDFLKALVNEANITTTGTIRFHLLRKFLMSELSRAGLNEWEVKIIVGKAIPVTDLTYLQKIKDDAFEKFCRDAYERIKLIGFTPKNSEKLEEMSGKVKGMEKFLSVLTTWIIQDLKKKGYDVEKLKTIEDAATEGRIEELAELLREAIES